MKRSGYRTTLHIYLIFFLSLLGVILATAIFCFLLVSVQKPDGTMVRSDWPKNLTEDFREQIILINGIPQVKQTGLELLQTEGIGLQVLDASGREQFRYQKPELGSTVYSNADLLRLGQVGHLDNMQTTSLAGTLILGGEVYTYILHFPLKVSSVTMYLNGERFTGGKMAILTIVAVLFLTVLSAGVAYGFWMTQTMKRMTSSIQNIAIRCYDPVQDHGVFRDLYESLNTLDAEIKTSDRLRMETESMRKEWIANITHDLKTPLSPIKGYAEILWETGGENEKQCKRYAEVMLKNVSYMETLIDDLKLVYQLENGIVPVSRQKRNIVRFLKELAIDVLNTPKYERRTIHFETNQETILFLFDTTLLTRAFHNLILNAFLHGKKDTEVTLRLETVENELQISVADTGQGMQPEEIERLFERYYRGGSTEQKQEGTGLGLTIAKNIVELHGGIISVSSIPGKGTTFQMAFPMR